MIILSVRPILWLFSSIFTRINIVFGGTLHLFFRVPSILRYLTYYGFCLYVFCRNTSNNGIVWHIINNYCIWSDNNIITNLYFSYHFTSNCKFNIVPYYCNLRIIMLISNDNARINLAIIPQRMAINNYPPSR